MECGITLNDFKELTLGLILGIIFTYVDLQNNNENISTRDAMQEDFDNF